VGCFRHPVPAAIIRGKEGGFLHPILRPGDILFIINGIVDHVGKLAGLPHGEAPDVDIGDIIGGAAHGAVEQVRVIAVAGEGPGGQAVGAVIMIADQQDVIRRVVAVVLGSDVILDGGGGRPAHVRQRGKGDVKTLCLLEADKVRQPGFIDIGGNDQVVFGFLAPCTLVVVEDLGCQEGVKSGRGKPLRLGSRCRRVAAFQPDVELDAGMERQHAAGGLVGKRGDFHHHHAVPAHFIFTGDAHRGCRMDGIQPVDGLIRQAGLHQTAALGLGGLHRQDDGGQPQALQADLRGGGINQLDACRCALRNFHRPAQDGQVGCAHLAGMAAARARQHGILRACQLPAAGLHAGGFRQQGDGGVTGLQDAHRRGSAGLGACRKGNPAVGQGGCLGWLAGCCTNRSHQHQQCCQTTQQGTKQGFVQHVVLQGKGG